MFVQKISLPIYIPVDELELYSEFNLLLDLYRGSGQIQWTLQSDFLSENLLQSFPYTLEQNSLKSSFNNSYVSRQIAKLEELCAAKMQIETVGVTWEAGEVCKCEQCDYYILYTNYTAITSPIICGGCTKVVPLYRIPYLDEDDAMPILSWQSNYQACDTLQMNCQVGEQWTIDQLQEVSSELSRQGLDICARITKYTWTPTYYFLYNYRLISHESDVARMCPWCNQSWYLDQSLEFGYFTLSFKCDHCNLISHKTLNSSHE